MAFETISLGSQPAGTGGDTARTAFEKVNRNFLAADVLAAAMSQAQFDANRNANKELYAASGWVSFGNHESGKQVNECKPGLYTALTTPNTLLIGKAGGVGGSKTDYASVHIDGVVFNLTNQFVLTLPSHPTSVLPERMDMYGVESEKVEISSASPNAYQGGLRGVGAAVNLFTATDQQKKDFFAQNSNTTFIGSDGKIYQWQLYKIAFAGTTGGVPSPTEQGYSLNSFGDLWLKAGKNLLYFGNVLRLNDGGYHPIHNHLGTAKFVGDTFWNNTAASITSKADCFDPVKLLAGSGSISSGKSGRPYGEYYDAVYASGQGGVCSDMRYSSYNITEVELQEYRNNLKISKFRGSQPLIKTTFAVSITSPVIYCNKIAGKLELYDSTLTIPRTTETDGFIVLNGGANIIKFFNVSGGLQYADYEDVKGILEEGAVFGGGNFALSNQLVIKVGGDFLQTDVLAVPEDMGLPLFSEGFVGKWIPDISPSSIKTLSRRKRGADGAVRTYASGAGWGVSIEAVDTVMNTTRVLDSNVTSFIQYHALAKQTKRSSSYPVYGVYSGTGNVFATSSCLAGYGSHLTESLIDKIPTERYGITSSDFTSVLLDTAGTLFTPIGAQHEHISIPNSLWVYPATYQFAAVKYLELNTNINKKAFIRYVYTELKNNGTDWGDNRLVDNVEFTSTKKNTNGEVVRVGSAISSEPVGWLKNTVAL